MNAKRMYVEPVRSLAFGSIGAAYMGVGTNIDNPVTMFLIQNLTDAQVMISFDGVSDNLPLNSNAYMLLDIASNKTTSEGFYLPEGQRIYAKHMGAAPTSGSVYLTVFYSGE